jgi:glycosyltransferase involved in cell wall biosynthesis
MPGRVLMVAFHFPPSGAVAAQRAHKFARYLPDFGWTPLVVSRSLQPLHPRDESFAGTPAPTEELDPFEWSRGLGLLPRSWVDPVRRYLCVPDAETGWKRLLQRRLPELILRTQADVLWANSVPTGSLVAAATVARATSIPLLLDFHNEWTRNMYYRPSTPRHDAEHHRLEREAIEGAKVVTTLNPLHTEDLRARFPGIRVETIENGCDPGDYNVAPPDPSRRPIVLTYAGTVYGHQSPTPLLRALAGTGRKDVEVRVIGDSFGQFDAGTWPFKVTAEGHRMHRDLGGVFSASSAFFLCLEPPAARQLPAKLYEYLRAGRPTFGIVPKDGAADRWIREHGAGESVDSAAPDLWTPALGRFLDQLSTFRPPSPEPFYRRTQAQALAALLDGARR